MTLVRVAQDFPAMTHPALDAKLGPSQSP
jgi:hypothetical protein